jgi:hypothetical protein
MLLRYYGHAVGLDQQSLRDQFNRHLCMARGMARGRISWSKVATVFRCPFSAKATGSLVNLTRATVALQPRPKWESTD